MTKLLEIQQVSKRFPIEGGVFRTAVGFVQALQNVSLSIERGETLALVGGSGCGKSTLARIIAGLMVQDSGELLWEGTALSNLSRIDRARRIQMVFQDPYASLNPKLSIGTQLQEVLLSSFRRKDVAVTPVKTGAQSIEKFWIPAFAGMTALGFRRGDVKKRSVALLESVGLSSDALLHYPFQFSGGQRQRIAIARALAMGPQLLIADEPLSALDVTTQAQMLALFGQLKASLGLTLLFITHDLAVAEEFADRVVVLRDGWVVEDGPASVVLRTPQHPYTRALLDAIPKVPC